MSRAPGRDQRGPMERLVRLATVLHHAGPAGVPVSTLVEVAGFTGEGDPHSQLGRELRHMRAVGWQIDNIAANGEDAVYRMTSVDSRLRIQLTDAQQAALRRAVLLADRGDIADRLGLTGDAVPPDLTTALSGSTDESVLELVLRAVRLRCLVHFHYKGSARAVHPGSVRATNGGWHLLGREDGEERVKVFVVSRMTEVTAEAPDTADRVEATGHPGLDPMTWEYDEPVEVTLRAAAEFAPDVRRWLGAPVSQRSLGEETQFVYRVTNRAALRARVYQLGTRVSVLGPAQVRREIIDELATMAGQ